MTSIDLSKLAPGDAVAALRSYPRRFRSALAPIDDDESIEETATQVGPDGESALDHTVDAVRSWSLLGQALHQVLVEDGPVLHPAVADPAQRRWEAPVSETVDSALEQLADGAEALADAASRISGSQWERRGTAAGGTSLSALDLVREAVRVGHDDLAAVERTLAAARTR